MSEGLSIQAVSERCGVNPVTLRAWERRERPEAPPLPVVALTAYALEDHRRRCFEAGCDGHLTKPITKAALLETIERFARPQPSS